MPDTKISALPAVVTPTDADEFAVNQAGASKKLTLAQIKAQAETAGAVATHAGAADPHTGYLKETDAPINTYVGPFHPALVGATGALSGANRGVFQSFSVLRPVTVTLAAVRIEVQSGNIDMAVYSQSGTTLTRLSSTGSTACPAVALRVPVNLGASVALVPGVVYWAAIAADNTTVAWGRMAQFGGNPAITGGQATSVFPLPASVDTSAFFDSKLAVVNFE